MSEKKRPGFQPRADVRSDCVVRFRLTHAERELLRRAADRAGVTLSTFLRNAAMRAARLTEVGL